MLNKLDRVSQCKVASINWARIQYGPWGNWHSSYIMRTNCRTVHCFLASVGCIIHLFINLFIHQFSFELLVGSWHSSEHKACNSE